MRKYCLLQLKRAIGYLPWGLIVVLVLFVCMSLVFNAMLSTQSNEEDTLRLQIGVVGSAQDKYLQWGLAALKFDSTSLSMEIIAYEEQEAKEALQQGKIAAYVVFPENFISDALSGNAGQLQLVSTIGATGLVSIVKDEITGLVDSILAACENGAYGAGHAILDHGDPGTANKHVDGLALEYVDFLFERSRMYRVESLEQNSIPFDRYMLGGLSVFMLMLASLTFAPLYIRADHALSKVLRAQRVGTWKQTFAEFIAYLLTMLLLLIAMTLVLKFGKMLPENVALWKLFLGILPTLLMITTLSYCVYTLSDHLISGVLLNFFLVIVLCFVGGCMYPIQVFPDVMQTVSAILPTGIARSSLTGCLLGADASGSIALLGYSAAFFAIALGARAYKTGKVQG